MPNVLPRTQRVQKAVKEIVVNTIRKQTSRLLKQKPAPIDRPRRNADGTRISDWMHPLVKSVRGKPRPASSYRCARRNEARRAYRFRAKANVA
jgi:hypothetical protein